MTNSTSITQFLLLAFADTWELQLLHFCLFLGIYLAALLSNGLIITTIACDHHLHTPMYFFLLNLSILNLGSISTTVPKSMANSLWDIRAICYAGRVVQLFFLIFLIVGEYCLLTIMAYDRYLAICTTGPSWAAELVSTWQQLPGAVLFSMLFCTLLTHFQFSSAKAMLWTSSSVKSSRSSSSPVHTPTSGKLGFLWLVFL